MANVALRLIFVIADVETTRSSNFFVMLNLFQHPYAPTCQVWRDMGYGS
jgi:hypothetical protein